MYDHWNMDALYTGVEDESFKRDMQSFKEAVEQINTLAAKCGVISDKELVREYLTAEESLSDLAEKLFCYMSLRASVNSSDTEAVAYMGRLHSMFSAMSGASAVLQAYIGKIDCLDEIIESDSFIGEFAYYLRTMRDDAQHLLGGKEEEIMSKYNISGGSAWSDLRDHLTSTVKVEYNGTVTNLSDIRNMAYEDDPEVRRTAYEAEMASYEKIKDSVAFALNSIKMQAITEAELRGFDSPMAKVLHYSRLKPATLDALLGAMVEYMPHFRRYLRALGKLLGHENGLPWYDLFAPAGNDDSRYTPEDARKYLAEVFKGFDGELAAMVDRAFAEDWIDFFPADGKRGGAFCMGLHSIQQSRVLTNFGGRFTDVMTLAHELGHAFHNYCIKDHRALNTDYSMPVAETASNFNEVLTMDYALSHAETRAQRLALLGGKLSDTTQIICDIYSRYLFEKSVIDSREDGFMFPDKLCELMLDAQKQAYGDGLGPNCLHKYMWICKSHYYSAGLSFYNWPYAFGGLFAQGLFAKYKEQGESFVPLYKKLLHATTVNSVEDTALIAGIDLTDPDFWRKGLDYFVGLIDEFVELTEAELQK